MPSHNDGNIVKRSSQYIDNISFDETTGLPMTELAGTDGANIYRVAVDSDGSIHTASIAGQLVPKAYDAINISSYDANGNPGAVEYYTGGLGGTLVATLTLTYDGSGNPLTVVRT